MGWLDGRIVTRTPGHVAEYVEGTLDEIDGFADEIGAWLESAPPGDLVDRARTALGTLELERPLLRRMREDSAEWGALVERIERIPYEATLAYAEARYQPGVPDRDIRQAIADWETGGDLEWVTFRRYRRARPWWPVSGSASDGLSRWAYDVEALNRLHEQFHAEACWWQIGVDEARIEELPKEVRSWLWKRRTGEEIAESIRADVRREWDAEEESYGWLQDFGKLQDRGLARYEWILAWLERATTGPTVAAMLSLANGWEECDTIFRGFHDADLEAELARFDARISASQSSRLVARVKDATVVAFTPASTLVYWGLPASRGQDEPRLEEQAAFERFEYRMAVYCQSPRRLIERFSPASDAEERSALADLELWYETYLEWQAESIDECYSRRIEAVGGPAALEPGER